MFTTMAASEIDVDPCSGVIHRARLGRNKLRPYNTLKPLAYLSLAGGSFGLII